MRLAAAALLTAVFVALIAAAYFAFGSGAAQAILVVVAFGFALTGRKWALVPRSDRIGKPVRKVAISGLEGADYARLGLVGFGFVVLVAIAALIGSA